MAIDTKEKRQAIASIGRPWMRNTFPVAAPDQQWRASVGNVYGGNTLSAAPTFPVTSMTTYQHFSGDINIVQLNGEIIASRGYGIPSITAPASGEVISLYTYQHPTGDINIHQDGDGAVVASLGYGATSITPPASGDVIAIYNFQHPSGDIAIHQTGTGDVIAGLGTS